MTDLHQAVRTGDVAQVHRILQRDPLCVNDRNVNFQTPLHFVYEDVSASVQADDRLPILKLLIECGADVNARQEDVGCTPLFVAVANNQIKGVKLLLESGADPNMRFVGNFTILSCPNISSDDKSIFELLVQHGAEINAVDYSGETPLDKAIRHCFLDRAQILMDAGAKANDIINILMEIDEEEDENQIKRFLIQHGSKIDYYNRFSLRIFYFALLRYGDFDTEYVDTSLIESGIDINGVKNEGEETTQLHTAVENLDEDEVRTLLNSGADVNAKSILDDTPLHLLLYRDTEEEDYDSLFRIARLLIEAGADLHTRDSWGFTPFQLSVDVNHSRVMNFILDRIAGVKENTLKCDIGLEILPRTFRRNLYPLAVAVTLGDEGIVDKLIEMGHHIEMAGTINYRPPLNHAVRSRQYEITKMLLEADCLIDERYPFHVPSIDLKKSEQSDLELVCLLWEFNCISIFSKSLFEAIWSIINQSEVNKIVSLLIFYYKVGLYSNKLDKDLTSMKKDFDSNEILSPISALCDDQLHNLEKDLVSEGLSKFDLLTMKQNSLVQMLNDPNMFKACVKLRSSFNSDAEIEYYEFAIKVRIDLAIEKRKLLDSAINHLSRIFQDFVDINNSNRLPHEVVCEIVSYLNVRELRTMTKIV